tara:strand:+ start:527 stop:922 length:396 start_codon:yes stop_codon:yes gene_type:complete
MTVEAIFSEEGLNAEQRKTLRALIDVVEMFRTLDSDMPTQTMLAFLYTKVVEKENDFATVKCIAKELNTSNSSASRNIIAHTVHNRQLKGGTMLLESFENPRKRNEKVVRLTNKGDKFLNLVLRRLGNAQD